MRFLHLIGSARDVSGVVLYPKIGGKTEVKNTATKENEDTKETSFTDTTGTRTSQLQLTDEAVNKTLQDLLGGTSGLASIFQAENASGIYNSTAANQAAGDLASKVAGEIAKLTGKTVTTVDESSRTETETERKRRENEFAISAEAHATTW